MFDRLSEFFSSAKQPYTNVRSAQVWWKPIEMTDPVSQMQKIHEVINECNAAKVPESLEVLQALMWLDSTAQPAFDALCFRYVSNPRMPKEIEHKLWKEICGFSQAMVEVYRAYVQASGRDNGRSAFEHEMPQVLARSLRYMAVQAKWHYFRFEKAPAKLWTAAHQYYRLAEIEGTDSNPFVLYPNANAEVTSCADEYIQLLMLATVSSNNLSVMQVDLIDVWLDSWSKYVQISRKYQKDLHHFCISLQDTGGPQKIGPEADGETYRYWGIGELVTKLQDCLAKLEAGATPVSLGLGERCHTASAIDLLKHLDVFWSMSMRNCQFQRTERKQVSKAASVIHGLSSICDHVKADNDRFGREKGGVEESKVDFDEIMDMRLYGFVSDRTKNRQAFNPYTVQPKQHDWQTWAIDNESASGLGAVLTYSTNEWVRPGVLVGMRVTDKDNWQVGVLRRLNRMNEDEVYAGVQILTAMPVTVSLHSDELDRIENITVSEIGFTGGIDLPNVRTAIYLPHQVDGNNINTLIMRAADYGHDRIYKVQARDKVFSVSLGGVLEKGIDWIWIAVHVLRQDA